MQKRLKWPTEKANLQLQIAQGKLARGKRLKAEDKLALMTHERSQGRKVSGWQATSASIMVLYKAFWSLVFLAILCFIIYAILTSH